MKDELFTHEEIRKTLWANAWIRVAGANDCKSKETATAWADAALSAFDSRFKKPVTDKQDKP